MNQNFMRSRARPIALAVVVLLVTLFFYTNIYSTHRTSPHDVSFLPPADGSSMRAIDAAIDDLYRNPLPDNAFDFAQKGDRIAKLADIVTLLRDHGIATLDSFNALVRKEFPWWTAANPETDFTQGTRAIGIVVCVGSKNIHMAGHLILSLRNVLGYKLPIQIAYAGDNDLSKKHQAILLKLSSKIELLNLLEHFDESLAGLQEGKFAMKPFAVIASRFRRTILVDADVIFLKNPATIFEEYFSVATSGTLFYHDRAYKMEGESRKAWIQSLLGDKPPSSNLQSSLFWKEDLWQEMESGVVAFDKGHPRVLMSLLFTAWMNTKSIREKETYVHMLGDKETYWLATELTNTSYYFQPEYAGLIGTLEPTSTSKICSAHILHMDRTGETPFWFNGGVLLNKALEGEELGTFTHFITGGATMSDQPAWRYDGNEYWCAEGKPAIALTEKKIDGILGQVLQEVRNFEGAFPA
jgi:alpha 1,3-mannosyltransferase